MFNFLNKKNWYSNRATAYKKKDYSVLSWIKYNYKKISKFDRIYIYGSDSPSIKVSGYIKDLGYNQSQILFIENNPDKRKNLNAISVNDLKKLECNFCILIISTPMDETTRQLKKAKIQKDQVFTYNPNKSIFKIKFFNIIKCEMGFFNWMLQALLIYSKYKILYKNKHIYVCPYPGTGDVLFTADIFTLILKKDNLKDNEYIVFIGSNSCKVILEHFDLKNIKVIPQKHIELLKFICSIFSSDKSEITYLGFWGLKYQRLARLPYTYSLSFREFLHALFLENKTAENDVSFITFKEQSIKFKEIFGESIDLKKVIILAPVAGIEFDEGIPFSFWEELADFLLSCGYHVYTNTNGKDVHVIRNTKQIFLDYDNFFHTLNEIKALIGLRSGLFDIMSSVKCKKIIFYPKRYSDNLFNFFSLKNNFNNITNCLEIRLNEKTSNLFNIIKDELSDEHI